MRRPLKVEAVAVRGLLLLICLLSCPLSAWELRVQTDPGGADVYLNNRLLGKSNEPILMSGRPERDLELQLKLWGHDDAVLTIPMFEIDEEKLSFPQPPMVLKAHNPLVWAYYHPLASVPGLLCFLCLGAWGVQQTRSRRASEERARKLESIRADGGEVKMVGQRIGDFILTEQLGQGGMAQVFRAVPADSLDDSKAVAIKLMLPEISGNDEHRERFIREAKVSKDLIHPNIVRLLNVDSHEHRPFLVLELIKGQPLDRRLEGKGLSLEQARDYLVPVLDALVYAHGKGLVHRDLKPSNIMVREDGVVKVMDFGLARRREVDKTITVSGCMLGTPGYMAPEQVSEKVDPRSDQYAMGVTAFELLTGKRPFDGLDLMQLILACTTKDIPDPRELRPDLPEPLAEAVMRLGRVDPDQRFADMEEARAALCEGFD